MLGKRRPLHRSIDTPEEVLKAIHKGTRLKYGLIGASQRKISQILVYADHDFESTFEMKSNSDIWATESLKQYVPLVRKAKEVGWFDTSEGCG